MNKKNILIIIGIVILLALGHFGAKEYKEKIIEETIEKIEKGEYKHYKDYDDDHDDDHDEYKKYKKEYYKKDEYGYKKEKGCSGRDGHTVDFSGYKNGILTEEEKEAIIYMREEEKLARDVYRELYKTTKSRVFENIPVSEKRHMDAFAQLIDRYDLEDPVKDESARGVFTNKEFEKKYKELIAKGKKSDKDAYEVGMMVEDINMFNLIKYGNATDKADLKLAYNTLLEQSKHHMTAFYKNLKRVGGDYKPKYITLEQMKEAIESGERHMGR